MLIGKVWKELAERRFFSKAKGKRYLATTLVCKQIVARRKHFPNIGVKEPAERKIFGAARGESTTHSRYERERAETKIFGGTEKELHESSREDDIWLAFVLFYSSMPSAKAS